MLTGEVGSLRGSGKGRCNEDCADVDLDGRCAVIVDGATGLTKANLTDEASDALWYARELARETISELRRHDSSIQEAMRSAGESVAKSYLAMPGAEALERIDLPNGSIVAARWDDKRLEVASLGDCTTVVVTKSGMPVVIHDATLDALDNLNYERMYRHAVEHGVSMHDARVALNDRFIEHRLLMNEPDGYWAVDISCKGYGHEWCLKIPVEQVAGVVSLTDGYAAAVEMGVEDDVVALAEHVLAGDGREIGLRLRKAESADEGCWQHHRSKTSDDATYLALRFS